MIRRLIAWLLVIHFIAIQICYYIPFIQKWLLTDNSISFVRKLFL